MSSLLAGKKEPALSGLQALVVDADRELALSLSAALEQQGCQARTCFDGGAGLRQAELHSYDLLLLDVMLPVLDGIEFTRRLRLLGISRTIVLLMGSDSSSNVVRGLNAGADDYIAKPLDLEVLIARIQARVRARTRSELEKLRFADLTLDLHSREADRSGKKLDLTRTEFAILECLMNSAGRITPRSRIIDLVWPDREVSENNLETYIRYLRRKVDQPGMSRLIHTARGLGYSLRSPLR